MQWLDGGGCDAREVGARACALDRLRASGIPTPRGFVLGRSLLESLRPMAEGPGPGLAGAKLPAELCDQIAPLLGRLRSPYAVRRSPLDDSSARRSDTRVRGRSEREHYLHLVDAAEVQEAVRRSWGRHLEGGSRPCALIVQRFIAPEVSVVVRRDRADAELLRLNATFGAGDLLAAKLVVPDRHAIRVKDGQMAWRTIGRKAMMSIPRDDGGLSRVPVPAALSRRAALGPETLAELAELWRRVEAAIGGLEAMDVAVVGSKLFVTTAVPAV